LLAQIVGTAAGSKPQRIVVQSLEESPHLLLIARSHALHVHDQAGSTARLLEPAISLPEIALLAILDFHDAIATEVRHSAARRATRFDISIPSEVF
jgi:hypothetical protein